MYGPVQNVGWSGDGLSLQVEVPVPKFLRTVWSANGDEWKYNGFEVPGKGTMWITVAQRTSVQETPRLLFEKAKWSTLGWVGLHCLP